MLEDRRTWSPKSIKQKILKHICSLWAQKGIRTCTGCSVRTEKQMADGGEKNASHPWKKGQVVLGRSPVWNLAVSHHTPAVSNKRSILKWHPKWKSEGGIESYLGYLVAEVSAESKIWIQAIEKTNPSFGFNIKKTKNWDSARKKIREWQAELFNFDANRLQVHRLRLELIELKPNQRSVFSKTLHVGPKSA